MNLANIHSRQLLLLELQSKLINKYGEDDYNVFVFGSFLTSSYQDGKSDIDLAVYTDSLEKYINISVDIEEFLNMKKLPFDLFYIDVRHPSPVYYAALSSEIWLTDYYPSLLSSFKEQCLKEVKKIMEERYKR